MKVVVVAAHPDDEALGCAGTMARHAHEGDTVDVVFVADGVSARASATMGEELAAREAAAAQAATVLGARAPHFLRFADNACDRVPLLEIVQRLEAVLATIAPDMVYVHHAGDLNIDHRIAHQAVLTACRPLPDSSVRAIHAFETLSSTEWSPVGLHAPFLPNRFVDITAYRDAKRAALDAYAQEMRNFPHPRSPQAIEAQWTLRGVAVGVPAAEAFAVIREIV